ncbi:MAG: diacylglycerol kinase family lipid kinase [Actinomycetota bacterium]|nr:diacylglycerol kinase family lipid kinase [Actinomycetota bacterium]
MASPFGRLTVIANPRAGRRRLRSTLATLERGLCELGLEHDLRLTEGPGDATRLARRALVDGSRFLVAVGGDGTVHEVVNGMFDHDRPSEPAPVLGVVAAGSGCDLIRTFSIPAQAAAAVSRLAGANVRPLDVAKLSYVDPDGRRAVRYFVNIAEAGLGGSTAALAARLPRWLGISRYFLGFWMTLPRYGPGSMQIETDDGARYEGRAVNVVVANCRFFGGGMQVSPRSEPHDGTLEVLVFTGPKSDSFTMLPRVYRGRHLPHAHVVEMKGRHFRLESDRPFVIEADGEVLGTTPATVEVLPQPVYIKV